MLEARVRQLEADVSELKRQMKVIVDSVTGGAGGPSPPPPQTFPRQRLETAKGIELFDGSDGRTIPFDPIKEFIQKKLTVKNVNCAVYFFFIGARVTAASGFTDPKNPRKTPAIAVFINDGFGGTADPKTLLELGFEAEAFYLRPDDAYARLRDDDRNKKEIERLNSYLTKMKSMSMRACISCGDVATLVDRVTKETFCSDKQCHPK